MSGSLHFVCTFVFFHHTLLSVWIEWCHLLADRDAFVSVFEQTGPALILQGNWLRIYYYCHYYHYCCYYWGQGDHSCWGGWSDQFFGIENSYSCPSWVITASQCGFFLKCFTVWLSHTHGVSYSVSSCFYGVCFVHTGVFLQCDKAFKYTATESWSPC